MNQNDSENELTFYYLVFIQLLYNLFDFKLLTKA